MTVAESWKRIESLLRSRAESDIKALPPGVTPDEISRVEAELGVALPDDVRASYAIHNGSGGNWICEQGFLMPLVAPGDGPLAGYGILELWRAMLDVGEAMARERSAPAGPIRDDWWHHKWIPLIENESGDFVCLDLDPAPGGRVGQVIFWRHEAGATCFLTASFAEWLAGLADSRPAPDLLGVEAFQDAPFTE